MEASQLFLANSPRTGSQALAEGVSAKTTPKSSDDSNAFLDMIKAGLNAQLEQTTVPTNSSTVDTIVLETNSELETATQDSESESMTDLVPALNEETQPAPTLSQTPVPIPVTQVLPPLLETLFIRQNLESTESQPNQSNAMQLEQRILSEQNQPPSSLVPAESASSQPSQDALSLQVSPATLTPLSVPEQARVLPFAQMLPSGSGPTSIQIHAAEKLVQSESLKEEALATLNLKTKTGTADQSAVALSATQPVKQGPDTHFDYWQNLFHTLTQTEAAEPASPRPEALVQTASTSAPTLFSWLLSNLGARLQNVNQSSLTSPDALQNQFLNLQAMQLPTLVRSSQALVKTQVLTLASDLQGQTPVASSDVFNLSLETQDFTQPQENNGFWPRANEITAATQPPQTDARAEWLQASTEKVMHELGERFAIVKQLTQRIQFLNQRDRSLELSLEPAHLGKLTMRLQQSAQQLSLQVFTEMPLAKDLIESHLQQLRNQLQAQGYDVQHIQVHLQSDQQFSQHSSSGHEQEFHHGSTAGHFDLFQSEDIFSEPELELDAVQAEPKSNHQINTLV